MSYLAVNVRIIFPATKDREKMVMISCNSFRVDSSWKSLTDNCDIVISNNLFQWARFSKNYRDIKPGSTIYLEAGYNGKYFREFTGVVTDIIDGLHVVIRCEDNMYFLKRTKVNKSFKPGKLKDLLKEIVPAQFKIDAADISLGSFVFRNISVSEVLLELKDNYGIYSYFVGDTLVVGKIYQDNPHNQVVVFDYDIKNFVSSELMYQRAESTKVRVVVKSQLANGKILKEVEGDKDGQTIQINVCNVTDRIVLQDMAKRQMSQLKFDGLKGTITGFGIPEVRHGYTLRIRNKTIKTQQGDYYVDSVLTTLKDTGAFRRTITIGKKAADQNF